MMEYIVNEKKYILHYQELKDKYEEFCDMTDDEFMSNLPSALHLACIICYLKELPTYIVLNDEGIIHELSHLIDDKEYNKTYLSTIRERFKFWLKLS